MYVRDKHLVAFINISTLMNFQNIFYEIHKVSLQILYDKRSNEALAIRLFTLVDSHPTKLGSSLFVFWEETSELLIRWLPKKRVGAKKEAKEE